jgi:hypothetical protein
MDGVRYRLLLWVLFMLQLIFTSSGTTAIPTPIPCSDFPAGVDRNIILSVDGGSMTGCQLVNTSVTFLLPLGLGPTSGPIPLQSSSIRGTQSSMVVRLVSTLPLDPSPYQASVVVIVENCTLTDATNAFVVDVHNASSLASVNLTVRDTIIRGASRGAVSIYRGALQATSLAGKSVPAMSVSITLQRSIIEIVGSAAGTPCSGSTVPISYSNLYSQRLPVLCPIFAGSVILTSPDVGTGVDISSVPTLNVSSAVLTAVDSNLIVGSMGRPDAYALSLVKTTQDSGTVVMTSAAIVMVKSVVNATSKGGMAVGASVVFTQRYTATRLGFDNSEVKIAGSQSQVRAEDADRAAPAAAAGLALVGSSGLVGVTGCSIQISLVESEAMGLGGPAATAGGLALYSVADVQLVANDVSLNASGSNLTSWASGNAASVASGGISLSSYSGEGTGGSRSIKYQSNVITSVFKGCQLFATANGSAGAATSGGAALSTFSQDSSASITDGNNTFSLQVQTSNMSSGAAGAGAAVANGGISLSGNGNSYTNLISANNNITLSLSSCILSATGGAGSSSVSIGGYPWLLPRVPRAPLASAATTHFPFS